MNKMMALAILAGGALLVIFGIAASNSVSSDVSRFFTAFPGSKSVWMLLSGAVLCVIGLVSVMRRPRVAQ